MACGGAGTYDQQRLAKKKYKLKKANQFKTNFIALWEKYGEFQDVNGVRCFSGYRIDCDGEGQKKMSRRLQQPDLYQDACDSHFSWVKLYFNLGKLNEVTADDVDAFFTYYKNSSHNRDADRLHYKLAQVANPDDYGAYDDNHVITEHWFEKKVVTVIPGQNGDPDTEEVTWEQITDDEFLDELSWELAYLALDGAVWLDQNLQPIDEITEDIELTEAELDAKIDGLRATKAGVINGITAYVVPTIGDKIEAYTIEQSVGANILDQLEYVHYFGDDGKYYLSVDAAKRMNGEVFVKLVTGTIDFHSKLKEKYKWRKMLLSLATIVGAGIALFFGQPYVAASILAGYIGSTSGSATVKVLAQVAMIATANPGGLAAMSSSEALNLIMNIAGLYFAMQAGNSVPRETTEDTDADQQVFYKTPYDLYDDIYCFDDMISISTDI